MIINPWNDFDPKVFLGYPYNKVNILRTRYSDGLGRSSSWLLASLAKFGELLQNKQAVPSGQDALVGSLPVLLVNRLCSEQLEQSDIPELLSMSSGDDLCVVYDLSSIQDTHYNEWRGKDLPDLKEHSEVILYQCLSRSKSVIFRLSVYQTVRQKRKILFVDVDGYFLGDVSCAEVDPLLRLIHRAIYLFLPTTTLFQFRRRLHVPPTFFADNIYITFLIINYLQFHGNYLDISVESISRTKLDEPHIQQLLALHDNSFLGQLDMEEIDQRSHHFVTGEFKGMDYLDDLENMGWHVIDVEGDGNCGFYAFLLGLENIGNKDFHVDTRQKPREKMSKSNDWMQVLHNFRHAMKDHSVHLLTNVYPKGKRDFAETMWIVAAVSNDEEIEGYQENKNYHCGLSECLAPKDYTPKHYVHFGFKRMIDYHMNVYWAPHVLASMLKMRVIVYLMRENPTNKSTNDSDDDVSENNTPSLYLFSSMSFEYKNRVHTSQAPHVEIIWKTDLDTAGDLEKVRIDDIEFNRIPTIEVLYQHKAPGGHFQFLRRVICSGILKPPIPDTTTLKDIMQQQTVVENWLAPATGDTTTRPQVPEDGNNGSDHDNDEDGKGTKDITNTGRDRDGIEIKTKAARSQLNGKIHGQESRTKRVHGLTTVNAKKERKNNRAAKKKRAELGQDTKTFNQMCRNGEIPATRMLFDSTANKYYTYNVENKSTERTGKHVPIKRTEVATGLLHLYNAKLIRCATETPDQWVGPTIEDANVNTGDAPLELCTNVVCLYQQHNMPYCIVYSFASALWYCKFPEGADWLRTAAGQFSEMNGDQQIEHLLSLAKNAVPLIGSATYYGLRTNRHDHKKRTLDWDTLFTDLTPYPTIVIPILPNGRNTHAFCVVDDLIFDSTNPCALKLCMESVKWLFQEQEPEIHRAYRFNMKYAPENIKVKGKYKRAMVKNW